MNFIKAPTLAREGGRLKACRKGRVEKLRGTRKKQIHNRKYLKAWRKDLRKSLTPAEAFLWIQLKNRKLKGRKFRRQHSIENFIVDFYCPEEQIVIELDGEVHNNPTAEELDQSRNLRLEKLGFKVLRFENRRVFDFLPSVLKEIENNFKD
ncbi:endonuclease domain-containing protein [Salegentibacter sp. HM20]